MCVLGEALPSLRHKGGRWACEMVGVVETDLWCERELWCRGALEAKLGPGLESAVPSAEFVDLFAREGSFVTPVCALGSVGIDPEAKEVTRGRGRGVEEGSRGRAHGCD